MHKNQLDQFLSLLLKLLPVAEGVASIFIHNPASQNQFTMIVGEVNTISAVAAGLAQSFAPIAPVAVPAAPAAK